MKKKRPTPKQLPSGAWRCQVMVNGRRISVTDEDQAVCQAKAMAALGRQVKDKGLDLMIYTGYTYEALREMAKQDLNVGQMLELADILVDGPYIMEQRDLELLYRGSKNQRLIDLRSMRKRNDIEKIIEWRN